MAPQINDLSIPYFRLACQTRAPPRVMLNRPQCNCAGAKRKNRRKEGGQAEAKAKQEEGAPPRGKPFAEVQGNPRPSLDGDGPDVPALSPRRHGRRLAWRTTAPAAKPLSPTQSPQGRLDETGEPGELQIDSARESSGRLFMTQRPRLLSTLFPRAARRPEGSASRYIFN